MIHEQNRVDELRTRALDLATKDDLPRDAEDVVKRAEAYYQFLNPTSESAPE